MNTMIKTISRPSIVDLAMNAATKAKGTYTLGAVITRGTSNKPVAIGYNSSDRTVYKFGTHRMISCSQHAEMSVASQLLNRLCRKGIQRQQAKVAKVAR